MCQTGLAWSHVARNRQQPFTHQQYACRMLILGCDPKSPPRHTSAPRHNSSLSLNKSTFGLLAPRCHPFHVTCGSVIPSEMFGEHNSLRANQNATLPNGTPLQPSKLCCFSGMKTGILMICSCCMNRSLWFLQGKHLYTFQHD
jgi:hypothetical protein